MLQHDLYFIQHYIVLFYFSQILSIVFYKHNKTNDIVCKIITYVKC